MNVRPLCRANYWHLKDFCKQKTNQYLINLNELLYELEQRRVRFDVEFREEIRQQIAHMEEQFKEVWCSLP